MNKTIRISREVHVMLAKLKAEYGAASFDELLCELLTHEVGILDGMAPASPQPPPKEKPPESRSIKEKKTKENPTEETEEEWAGRVGEFWDKFEKFPLTDEESRSSEPKEPEKNSTDLDDKPLLKEKSGPAHKALVKSLQKKVYGQKQGKRGKK